MIVSELVETDLTTPFVIWVPVLVVCIDPVAFSVVAVVVVVTGVLGNGAALASMGTKSPSDRTAPIPVVIIFFINLVRFWIICNEKIKKALIQYYARVPRSFQKLVPPRKHLLCLKGVLSGLCTNHFNHVSYFGVYIVITIFNSRNIHAPLNMMEVL